MPKRSKASQAAKKAHSLRKHADLDDDPTHTYVPGDSSSSEESEIEGELLTSDSHRHPNHDHEVSSSISFDYMSGI
jgi:hypothetical protein